MNLDLVLLRQSALVGVGHTISSSVYDSLFEQSSL